MAEPRMIPVIQLQDDSLARRAIDHLRGLGIGADSVPLSQWPAGEMPSWVDVKAGGMLLTMQEDRFEEGMRSLEPLFGYGDGP